MPIGTKLTDRYEVKQTLGQGGMGIVYWAYDNLIRRDVALKTIRDAPEPAALELFYKECNILASISHPNIIEIFDIGKFEDEGVEKPYFVMPLLKGVTLDNLIKNSSRRLTVDRTVEMLCQTCRGLQAAHEQGLVHRDLKPSNIFVLEDDSIKIIDFGVAHMAGAGTASAAKGTLLYMSPEQVQLKPASALSDIFTLGVVAYEALTLRRPFDAATNREIAQAILHHIPPPASDINPAVSPLLGRVVHKTMAKQPWNRFSTARELSEALQKAIHNQPIESFDSAKIQPRIDRAAKAFNSGDLQFASEILTELESEGHLLPEMAPLRRSIDQAVRQKMLAQLLESARTRIEDEEYPLALQKIQEALDIDPENTEALRLQREIESNRSTKQVEEWYRLARQHLERFAFPHARQALDNVLQLRPDDPQAHDLMAEIQRREQQYLQLRQEKEKLYQSAVDDYQHADLTLALGKLERVLDLDRQAPEISSSERGASYQGLYNKVRTEQDTNMASYAEARRLLAENNFDEAAKICEQALEKYPNQALFQALRVDIEDRKRKKLSAYIAEVDRNTEAEPDLDKRVDILRAAVEQFPGEQHFERSLRINKDKRDLVASIVSRARRQEEQAQFAESLSQWEILRSVYPQYPGLDFEVDRVTKRRDQQMRNDAKARLTQQIDRQIEARNFAQASSLLREAQAQYSGDTEFEELAKVIRQGEESTAGKQLLVDQARAFNAKGQFDDAERILRQAWHGNEGDIAVRGLLVDTLVSHARSVLDRDWKRAGELVDSALQISPSNAQARGLSTLIADKKRDEAIDQCINRARQAQAAGDLAGALSIVEELLVFYPTAARLLQLKSTLERSTADAVRPQARRTDLDKLTELKQRAEMSKNPDEQREILASVRELAAQHLDDPEFQTALIAIEKRYVGLGRVPILPTMVAGSATDPLGAGVAKGDSKVAANAPLPGPPPIALSETPQPEVPIAESARLAPPPFEPPKPQPPKPEPPVHPVPELGTIVVKVPAFQSAPPPAPPPPLTPAPPITPPPPPAPLAAPSTREFPEPPKAPIVPPAAAVPTASTVPTASLAPPPPALPPGQKINGKLIGAFIGGLALIGAILAGGVWYYQQPPKMKTNSPQSNAATIAVDLKTQPDGAAIAVDDQPAGISNTQLKLTPGPHRIAITHEGYRPFQTSLNIAAGQPANIGPIVLQPSPTTFRLLTDLANASITLDGQPQNSLQSGQMILDNIVGGSHVVAISGGGTTTTINFDAHDGQPPELKSLVALNQNSVIVIANLGARARIFSNEKAGTINFDGKPAGSLTANGVELTSVSPGDHEISIGDGSDHRKVVYETAQVPALTVYLNNGAQDNTGTLVVLTGEDDVRVTLDGQPLRVPTRRGQLRIPNAPARQYVIAVSKEGYQPVPEQHVTVKRGEETKVTFQLRPVPSVATFQVSGAVPGTQVVLDGKALGAVGQDGTLAAVQVAPGSHTVRLSREEYKTKTLQLNFTAGNNTILSGTDVVLEGAFGNLAVAVSPNGAQVLLHRQGEPQRPLAANPMRLPEGMYTVTVNAPHFISQSTNVEVAAGTTRSVTIQLVPERVAPTPHITHLSMSGWQFPAAWTPEGDHYTRKGGNLVLFTAQGVGTYTFTGIMKHGSHLRWVAHLTDEKNYAEFEIDSDNFIRRLVTDGHGKELVKRKHGIPMQSGVGATIQMIVSSAGIVQRIQRSDGWAPLDSWADPSLHEGRFGFNIRGRDEVNLSNFSFTGSE